MNKIEASLTKLAKYPLFSWLKYIIDNELIRKFLSNFTTVLMYNGLSYLLGAICMVISITILGPVEYGKIALIISLLNILVTPIVVGQNASLCRFLQIYKSRQKIISTAVIGNCFTCMLLSLFYILIFTFFGKNFNLDKEIWVTAVIIAVFTSFFLLLEGSLRGQEKYSIIGKSRLIGASIFIIFLAVFLYIFKVKSFIFYFISYSLFQLFFIFNSVRKLKIKLFPFSKGICRIIYSHGVLIMLNALISRCILASDIMIVNYFFSDVDVGIYGVYQGFVNQLFSVIFYEIFSVVFLPTIAKLDKIKLYMMFNKKIPLIISILIPVIGVTAFLILKILGKAYTPDIKYILLVATGISLYFIFQIYNTLFSMDGNRGAILCLLVLSIVFPLSLFIKIGMIKNFGIAGALLSVVMTNIIFIVVFQISLWVSRKRKIII